MLYAFVGDAKAARKGAQELIAALQKKRPEAMYVRITDEACDQLQLEELTQSQGLFYRNYIVFFDGVVEACADISWEKWLPALAEAPHVFVFLAQKMPKDLEVLFSQHAQSYRTYQTSQSVAVTSDHSSLIFQAARALAARKIPQVWQLFVKLPWQELAEEQVHGAFLWALKQTYQAKTGQGKVTSAFQSYAREWDQKTLEQLLLTFSQLPHQARRQGVSLKLLLEQAILSLV